MSTVVVNNVRVSIPSHLRRPRTVPLGLPRMDFGEEGTSRQVTGCNTQRPLGLPIWNFEKWEEERQEPAFSSGSQPPPNQPLPFSGPDPIPGDTEERDNPDLRKQRAINNSSHVPLGLPRWEF